MENPEKEMKTALVDGEASPGRNDSQFEKMLKPWISMLTGVWLIPAAWRDAATRSVSRDSVAQVRQVYPLYIGIMAVSLVNVVLAWMLRRRGYPSYAAVLQWINAFLLSTTGMLLFWVLSVLQGPPAAIVVLGMAVVALIIVVFGEAWYRSD